MFHPLGPMLQSIWMNVLDLLLSLTLATAEFIPHCDRKLVSQGSILLMSHFQLYSCIN